MSAPPEVRRVVVAPPAPPAPRAAAVEPARQPSHRTASARALAELIRAASAPEPEVRRTAVRALGRMGDDAAVTPLVRSLRDRDSDVRSMAARMLGELAGGRPAPDELSSGIAATTVAEPPRRASRLGDAAADRAAEALRVSLADEDPRVRDTALWALGEIGGEQRGGVILGGQTSGATGVESALEGSGY